MSPRESWREAACERHQIIVLLDAGGRGSLSWRVTGEPKNRWEHVQLLGQQVVCVERKIAHLLSWEEAENKVARASMVSASAAMTSNKRALAESLSKPLGTELPAVLSTPVDIVRLSFTDDFIAAVAPDFSEHGVLVKSCFELMKRDLFIGGILEKFRELSSTKKASPPAYIQALGVIFVTEFLRVHRTKCTTANGAKLSPEQLQKALDYIEAHVKEPLHIASIYRVVGLGKTQFCKLFKASTGMTPSRYILLRRVRYAQQLLREGRLRTSEIALAAGFFDQSHMGRSLKQFCEMDALKKERTFLRKKRKPVQVRREEKLEDAPRQSPRNPHKHKAEAG
jgi:AraC-like DNA-binding protein